MTPRRSSRRIWAALAALLLLSPGIWADGEKKEEDPKKAEAEARAKELERIERRREFKGAFTAVERGVADKIEAFALQPVRDWISSLEGVVKEPKESLLNPLRYYLLDDDWEVVAFACTIIGKVEIAALLPEMEEAYDGAKYAIVRRRAAEAAARIAKAQKTEAALALIKKGLEDEEPGVRLLAVEGAEWLKKMDLLRKAAKDKDADTRFRALGGLARLDDTAAQKVLLDEFRSYVGSKDLQRRASLETKDVGERYAQFLCAHALGYWGGKPAMKPLSRALVRNEEYRNKLFLSIGAAKALGTSRPLDPDAKKDRDRALSDAIRSGDAVVRAMGAFGAGYTAEAAFVPALQRLLKDAQSDVRHNAVEALGRIPGAKSIELLAQVLRKERDVPVRLAAIRALSRHEDDAATAALAKALRDKRYMVRVSAAKMLGRRGNRAAAAVPALVKAARDPDYGVREAAVIALAAVGSEDGLPAIAGALKDRDSGVKVRALRGLARFPRPQLVREDKDAAQRAVSLLLSARSAYQRRVARAALLKVRSPFSVPPLIKALDSDKYSKRNQAFMVLRDYNRGASLDYTSRLAGDARKKAVKRWKDWWKESNAVPPQAPPPKQRANLDFPSFHRYTRDLRWRGIDLVLAYDSTGSMIPVIRAVKQRLDLLIEESARIVPNLRMSLFTYRDEGEEYVYYGTPLTYALDNLKAFVQVAEANRGGDLPEAVTSTVDAAIKRLQWRKDALKVIVVIGDAPYHPENATRLFALVSNFAKKSNRGVVHALFTDPNRLGESISARRKRQNSRTRYPFLERFREMARAGGGKAITIEDTEMLISEVLVLSFGEQWRSELESRLEFQ